MRAKSGQPVARADIRGPADDGLTALKRGREVAERIGMGVFASLRQDTAYGARLLRKNPGLTLTAVLSLALGIGGNTAVFSIVHAVLMRGLPYPEAERLVRVGQRDGDAVSMAELQAVRERDAVFASAAGYRGVEDASLEAAGAHEWVRVLPVTSDFFTVLGVRPALGKALDAPRTVLLTDALWRRAFGCASDVPGRVVKLGGTAYTVAGVLPRSFWFPRAADAFIFLEANGSVADRGWNTETIARLKAGVPVAQAAAELASSGDEREGLSVTPYHAWLTGDIRLNLLLLFGAAALVVLIACSNVAGVLLARMASRRREIAVRLAVGGTPGRLMRQFLVENLLLAVLGGAGGLLAAVWFLDGLLAVIPFELPTAGPIRLDWTVMAFTMAVALGTGLVFSVAPLAASRRLEIHPALRVAGRAGEGGARQRLRSVLVVGEVALSVSLLVAAALLIQSLARLGRERLGFAPRGLISFRTPPPGRPYRSGAERAETERRLAARLGAVPGVRGVAWANVLPLDGQNNYPVERDGHPEQGGGVEVRIVAPSYFETMGIAVRRGRAFDARDTSGAPPVIAVNEALARRWWVQGSPLGDRLAVGRLGGQPVGEIHETPREVVAVVADTKTVYLNAPPGPTVYIPSGQAGWYTGAMSWVVRAGASAGMTAALRDAVANVDPRLRVERLRPMESVIAATTAHSRFDAWLFGTFAALALALAAVGIYGLLSFSVVRRTQEIGTRMALGARRGDVLRLVMAQGVGLTAAGVAIGLVAARALTGLLTGLLFGVKPADPESFLAAAVVLVAVGALASWIPARRATRVDPTVALRYE